jgi:2-iminobutanoate/2-iminopropanoate deaminase
MDGDDRLNASDQKSFDDTRPARSTVGVCELLGGAVVTIDAVVALE